MAMSLQGAGKRGRGRRGQPIGDINVTPLVDVMLVLLIVFMVTAPLLTSGVPIDLPQTAAPELKVGEQAAHRLGQHGRRDLSRGRPDRHRHAARLDRGRGRAKPRTEQRIYIRGDAGADYGLIMQVMGELSNAGYAKIGLITRQPQASVTCAGPSPHRWAYMSG